MKTTKIKKLYNYELQLEYKKYMGLQPSDPLDYRVRNMFEDLTEEGLYVYDYSKRSSRWRVTFPLFILFIFLGSVFGAFKWLFTGSAILNNKSLFVSNMVKWDKFCGFNIL